MTTIVMRAHNDMPLLAQTLASLRQQTVLWRLLGFDNASDDGSRELLRSHAYRVLHVPAGEYVPGEVLNRGMQESTSDIVVFLNADCEPVDEKWLENLLKPFRDPEVAAVFGRQMPRPDCLPLAALDIEQTYGEGAHQQKWRHCFSMASSAVRRSAWMRIPFDERLQYSEDIGWSWQIRQAGYKIQYAARSRVYHSHNYTARQWHKRQYGEGKAEACIFEWSNWQRSFLRYSFLPFLRQMTGDIRYSIQTHRWEGLLASPSYRLAQMVGRRKGFLAGLEEVA
jgi:GT2 family glycosyltransferase